MPLKIKKRPNAIKQAETIRQKRFLLIKKKPVNTLEPKKTIVEKSLQLKLIAVGMLSLRYLPSFPVSFKKQ